MERTVDRRALEKADARSETRVLLVEDNPGDARLVQAYLDEWPGRSPSETSYVLAAEASVAGAQAQLAQSSFDIVLLDLSLPDSSGLDTVSAIAGAAPDIPIVVLSGLADRQLAFETLQAGAQDYLVKGRFDGDQLDRAIRYAIERRQSARQLEDSERANRAILNSMDPNIAVVDGQGIIRHTNKAWRQFARDNGLEPTMAGPGVDYLAAVHRAADDGDEVAQRALDGIQGVIDGAQSSFHFEYPCSSPETDRWFMMRVTQLESGSGAVIVHVDITDRRVMEVELDRQQVEIRTLVDNSPEVIARYSPQGEHLYISPAIEGLTGHPPTEYIGHKAVAIVPPDRQALWEGAIQSVATSGEERLIEFSHQVNGRRRSFRTKLVPEYTADGQIGSVLAVSHDVSDLVEAHEALQSREAVLEAISFASERYLTRRDWRPVTPAVLGRLGLAARADRAYLFENGWDAAGRRTAGRIFEWAVREELALAGEGGLEHVAYADVGYERWESVLGAGGTIDGSVTGFPASEHAFLNEQQVRSLAVVPVFVGSEWWGCMGFDDCSGDRVWDPALVDALRTAAGVLGAAIQRERAEHTLSERERRFRALVENGWDGVAIADETGNVLYATESIRSLLGLDLDSFLGTSGFQLIHPDDVERAAASFKAVAKGRTGGGRLELRVRRADGEWRWFNMVGTNLMDDPAVGGIVVNFHDVTARRAAEDELLRREELYRSTLENITDVVAILDSEGRSTYLSPSALTLTGVQTELLLGQSVFEYLHPDDVDEARRTVKWALEHEGQSTSVQFRLLHVERGWVEIEAVGRADRSPAGELRMLLTARDVTDRRLMEAELRRERDLLGRMMETSPTGILMFGQDGCLTYANPQSERILGVRQPDIIGRHFDDPAWGVLDLEGHHLPEENMPVASVYRSGRAVFEAPAAIRRENGVLTYLSVNAAPVLDPAGEVMAVVTNLHDITEFVKAGQAVEASERRFRSLVQNSADIITITDGQGTVVYETPALKAVLGYEPEQVIGRNVFDTVHPADVAAIRQQFQQTVDDPAGSFRAEARVAGADGELHDLEIVANNMLDDPAVGGVVFNSRDVTQRRRHQREQESIVQTSAALRAAARREDMPPIVLRQAMELLGAGGGAIVLLSEDRRSLKIELAAGSWEPTKDLDLTVEGKIDWELYIDGKTYLQDDVRQDPDFAGSQLLGEDTAVAAVPLMSLDGPLGTIWLGRHHPFREEEVSILRAIADMAGNAMRRASLHEETQEYANQMATVSQLGLRLGEVLDAGLVYQQLAKAALQLLPKTHAALISRYDADRREFTLAFGLEQGEEIDVSDAPSVALEAPGEGTQSQAVWTKQAQILNDFSDLYIRRPQARAGGGPYPMSGMSVPLVVRGQVIGVLQLQALETNCFRQRDASLMALVANTAAVAISNADLFMETKRRVDQLGSVASLGQALGDTLDIQLIFPRLAEAVEAMLGDVSTVIIARYDRPAEQISCAYLTQDGQAVDVTTLPPIPLEPTGQGTQSEVVRTGRPMIIPDLPNRLANVQTNIAIGSPGPSAQSALLVPMMARGEVIGVMQAQSYTPDRFDANDADLLALLANTAAVAIYNADLFYEAQGTNVELALAYDTTLEGWAKALELRDKETEGHARRVTDLAVRLAAAMGVPAQDLIHLRRGALLHDIGKMGIPDSILLKPGSLSDDEWAVMRSHPTLAYNLLSPVDFLQPALDIPYGHHERWNGQGYPRGLTGEAIPLAARVFAVVDVYDALGSDRPYRAAWPEAKVRDYLRRQAGVEFDPAVVDAFLGLLGAEANMGNGRASV